MAEKNPDVNDVSGFFLFFCEIICNVNGEFAMSQRLMVQHIHRNVMLDKPWLIILEISYMHLLI